MGQTIIKGNARKVRPLGTGLVIAGFAGATADAMTLFERLEAKLEQYPAQLTRACVEMAKDWRTDRYLRRLEAMMIVADVNVTLVLTGTGDVLGTGARRHRHRLGRKFCAGRGPRPDRHGHGGRSHRPQGHGDCGGDLRLHQWQCHG